MSLELPQLELITWDTSEQKLLLETIIDQWKQNLGLENIQLTQYVIGTAIGSFYDLSYDLFAITWETDVLPTDIMEAMVTGGEVNYGIWSDARVRLPGGAGHQRAGARDKQAELTAQAEQIFLDNAAILPLYENGVTGAVQSYVEGFQMSATSSGYQFNQPGGTQVNKQFCAAGSAAALSGPVLPALSFSERRPALKRYILKRLVISIITIWLIATCSFFLLHALPGNPFGTTQLMSQEMRDKMMAYYGLDRPPLGAVPDLYVQPDPRAISATR